MGASKLDPDAILGHLQVLSANPFQETLSRVLAAEPDPDSMKKWAERSPDRWAQCVAIFARLSGYSDKTINVRGQIDVRIHEMSDAECKVELARQLKALGMDEEAFMAELARQGGGDIIEGVAQAVTEIQEEEEEEEEGEKEAGEE